MINLDKAMMSPTSEFSSPDQVLEHASLTREQKIAILKRWESDARELSVAEEENMGGGPPSFLGEILNALRALGESKSEGRMPPTKQGG